MPPLEIALLWLVRLAAVQISKGPLRSVQSGQFHAFGGSLNHLAWGVARECAVALGDAT
jgi:hypothetical protein